MLKHLKITKRSLKSPGTAEEDFWNCGAVAACLLHAPPRAQPEGWVDLSRFPLLSPSAPAVGSKVTCKAKKRNKQWPTVCPRGGRWLSFCRVCAAAGAGSGIGEDEGMRAARLRREQLKNIARVVAVFGLEMKGAAAGLCREELALSGGAGNDNGENCERRLERLQRERLGQVTFGSLWFLELEAKPEKGKGFGWGNGRLWEMIVGRLCAERKISGWRRLRGERLGF
ncbi:hypothetical protein NC651_026308 [Populus alba x Populus x berolinensis]|nr:hypothetical protein NC651_026308 [Populus alba x Populus x berolinensis]